jgi:hypothetical protein
MPLSEEGRSCGYNTDNSIARHWKLLRAPFTHLPFSQPALPKTSFNLIANSVSFPRFSLRMLFQEIIIALKKDIGMLHPFFRKKTYPVM